MKIEVEEIEKGIIVLNLDTVSYIAESSTYYWSIDNNFLPGDESTTKVLLNLKGMLEKWGNLIQSENDSLFLPFDFADEYLGCLRVRPAQGSKIMVDYGYTKKYQGWSLRPSGWTNFKVDELDDFDALSESFDSERRQLIDDIQMAIARIYSKTFL